MTLYHLLHEQGLVPGMVDFNEPRLIDGECCVFDHNLSDRYGFSGENTYELRKGTKSVVKKDGKFITLSSGRSSRSAALPRKDVVSGLATPQAGCRARPKRSGSASRSVRE